MVYIEIPTIASSTVNIIQTNVIHSETGKMPGHLKRKYHDQVCVQYLLLSASLYVMQAYSKMHPVLQKIGVRSAELLIVCFVHWSVYIHGCVTHTRTHTHTMFCVWMCHTHAHTHTHTLIRTVDISCVHCRSI